jgi:hypothetical protein
MFKMIEVIGSSEKGYSQAVKEAVEQVIEDGHDVHFFEVVEQRGAARAGKFKEFQVKIKVAVSRNNKQAETGGQKGTDICPTCLQETDGGHLCVPAKKEDHKCSWCGALIPDERHLCNDKIKELSYICNSCGRTAVKPEHLCNPKKIK